MHDERVGAVLRALRIRRGLRQADVARLAVVSAMTVSRIERGRLESVGVRAARRVALVLDVRLDFSPWSRHGDLHRFATEEHAGLVESVIRFLDDAGWEARAEVSFSHGGERGFVDVLAWHAPTRALLVIEVKTEIVDVGELLGTLDRKRRLAPAFAGEAGWVPRSVATVLIVEATRTNRRRVADHSATIRSQLPEDGRHLRALIRHPDPAGAFAGVMFWPNNRHGVGRQRRPGSRRVRRANSCSAQSCGGPRWRNPRG